MKHRDWSPSVEMLAAYEDGEYDGGGDADLRARLEAWLAEHPEAAAELDAHRRLRHLWHSTTPAEPKDETWAALLARIQAGPRPAPATPWRRSLGWMAGVLAAGAAAVLLGFYLLRPPNDDEEPFIVATADEVEILSVGGADTQLLVVGTLPVRGPIELLEPGEVTLTSAQPDARDNMVPALRDRPLMMPMIWAPLETEVED